MPTHKFNWTGHNAEKHQLCSPVAGQGDAHEDRLPVCVPLSIEHPDQEGMSVYQGSKWDPHQEAVEYTQGAGEGVRTDCGCDIGYINSKHGWPTDKGASVVV